MRARLPSAAVLVAAVGALSLAWSVGRESAPARSVLPAVPRRSPEKLAAPPASIDPRSLRDVFRFADAPAAPGRVQTGRAVRPAEAPAPELDLRLVGLIWRGGRLLAALAIDGEVVLAGAGETVGETTVLSLDGEAVRVRRRDGTEQTLTPP